MKLKNITPKEYQCAAAACPAVYEIMGENKLAIIGHKLGNPEKLGITGKIGENEQIVIVDKVMLQQIFEK
ncbi:MAG: hypothetical protein ABII94_01335 [Patescibacteria group bacterium]